MDEGFFIAQKLPDGAPGRPIGTADEAISMFESLEVAVRVRDEMAAEVGPLSIYRVNMSFVGEVLL